MLRKPKEGVIFRENERFEGYVKDLLDGITEILNATYELSLVADGLYGNYDKKKREWNGLIREILDRVSNYPLLIFLFVKRRQFGEF